VRIGADKREATDDELSALLNDTKPFSYESLAAIGAKIQDIDEAHLWSFMRGFSGGAFDEQQSKAIRRKRSWSGTCCWRRIVRAASCRRSPVSCCSVAMKASRVCCPVVGCGDAFQWDNPQAPIVERVELKGNLATVYESALKFVTRYADLWDARPNQPRTTAEDRSGLPARANYQRASISEALANALIHRDLALRDISTRITYSIVR